MRKDLITDAAIALVAEQGMRGLTHRAVDRRAGLPEGSTSAYFRTRKALVEGFVERLASQERISAGEAVRFIWWDIWVTNVVPSRLARTRSERPAADVRSSGKDLSPGSTNRRAGGGMSGNRKPVGPQATI